MRTLTNLLKYMNGIKRIRMLERQFLYLTTLCSFIQCRWLRGVILVSWIRPGIALHAHLQALLLLLALEARTGLFYSVGIERLIDAVIMPLGL